MIEHPASQPDGVSSPVQSGEELEMLKRIFATAAILAKGASRQTLVPCLTQDVQSDLTYLQSRVDPTETEMEAS